MMDWIDEKISEYYNWLKDNTAVREDKGTGWFAISTPFAGLFNDNIEIFIKKKSESDILLSDDGETINNLLLSGVDLLKSDRRKGYLDKILTNHGVSLVNGELISKSNGVDFAKKKHSLISAILCISDMVMLAKDNIFSIFSEDVLEYANSLDLIYTPSFIVKGKSGLDFNFDFQIAGRKSELVVKSFNTLKKDGVGSFLFCLNDIKEIRESSTGKKLNSLAIVNDSSHLSDKLIGALKTYGTNVILWSERNNPESKNLLQIA